MRERLDIAIIKKGLAESRSRARELIKNGSVKVNGEFVKKQGHVVNDNAFIEVDAQAMPYVSRAGNKLEHALETFKINLKDKVCLDIGASTGGFTDCMLTRGARKVVAVEIGKNVLSEKIKNDRRVEWHEGVDINRFRTDTKFDFIAADVSFDSVTSIMPALYRYATNSTNVVLLVKPQFEVSKRQLNRSGVVSRESARQSAFDRTLHEFEGNGFRIINREVSPLAGKKGNIEYLAHLQKGEPNLFARLRKLITGRST